MSTMARPRAFAESERHCELADDLSRAAEIIDHYAKGSEDRALANRIKRLSAAALRDWRIEHPSKGRPA